MVSITGLLVADGLGTVLPVVLLLVLVGLCRGWVWLPNCVIPSRRTVKSSSAPRHADAHHHGGRSPGSTHPA
jgi:hypothetical protein